MPKDERGRGRRDDEQDPEAAQEDLAGSLEQLDRAAARIRQLIYRIRPLLREEDESGKEGDVREERRPVRGQFRRRRN